MRQEDLKYVPQFDDLNGSVSEVYYFKWILALLIFSERFTVRELLTYTGQLQAPASERDIRRRVSRLLSILGLNRQAHWKCHLSFPFLTAFLSIFVCFVLRWLWLWLLHVDTLALTAGGYDLRRAYGRPAQACQHRAGPGGRAKGSFPGRADDRARQFGCPQHCEGEGVALATHPKTALSLFAFT